MQATSAFWCGCSQQDSHQADVWLGQPFTDSQRSAGLHTHSDLYWKGKDFSFYTGDKPQKGIYFVQQNTQAAHKQ